MKLQMFVFAWLALVFSAIAQQYPGYTLIAPQNSSTARLVDTNGTTYKSWTLSGGNTGYSSYLLPDRSLLRTVVYSGNQFSGGGATGKVQKVDWNGNVVWTYQYSTSQYSMHHDICPMPNGNVLLISYDLYTPTQATAAGCSSAITIWSEKIVEIQPVGATGGNVVWEWKVWDHLCQNVDATKANYVTSIVNNPQLFNINKSPQKDWLHMNGIDYNAELDQIVISSHNWHEFYVIDHSTTTAQAASHSGGNSGKGGDILYRWGNPANYGATGTKVINVCHDAHWIPTGSPNAGRLAVFNNGGTTSNSTVDMVDAPRTGYIYTVNQGSAFEPTSYTARVVASGRTTNMGNSNQLPNGNHLICVALSGKVYETDATGNVLWTYNVGGTLAQAHRYSEAYVNGSSSSPTLSATATPASVCEGESSTLSATIANGSGFTYSWTSIPAGFTSTAQNPTVTPTQTTSYVVTATNGSTTLLDTVVITLKPKPTLSGVSGPISVVQGTTNLYFTPSTPNTTYQWIVTNAVFTTAMTGNQVEVKFTNTGTVTLTVVATSVNGCTSTTTITITSAGTQLSISPFQLTLTKEAQSSSAIVQTNTDWTATEEADWLSIGKSSGTGNDTIPIQVLQNTSTSKRSAVITVKAGTATVTLTVMQEGTEVVSTYGKRYVKFSVDMREQTVNTTGVHVSGDFQEEAGFAGGDWQPNTTPLTKEGTSTIYSTVVLVPVNAKYEYKFLNGDQFYDSEFVPDESRVLFDFNDNRWFVADSAMGDTIYLAAVLYAGNAPYNKKLVRFRVDMQKSMPVASSGVHVAGTFQPSAQQWNAAYTMAHSFDGSMYEVIGYVDSGSTHYYKFYNGNTVASTEVVPSACAVGGNRVVTVANDVILETVCFNSCTACITTDVENEVTPISDVRAYPNPFASALTVELPAGVYSISLKDVLGKELETHTGVSGGTYTLGSFTLPIGMYVVTVYNHSGSVRTITVLHQ